jgi:hypothetical protein
MSHYASLFIEGSSQFVALFAVLLVWLGFTALGAFAGGRDRLCEVDHLIGWALVSFLFTVSGVFLAVPFTILAAIAAVAAVATGVFAWRRDRRLLPEGWARVLILSLPLLVLASAIKGSQWDEFTDWLVIPRYLLETDAFPGTDNVFSKAVYTGYPYSWHFVSYLAGRIGGRLLESAGALSNLLLLFGFGLLTVRLVIIGAGRQPEGERIGWPLAALAIMVTALLNPTFSQKIVLTSYAETSSAIATGTAAVVAWFILEALGKGEHDRAHRLAWALGLILALLINLKQATMVLAVLVVLATLFVAIRDRNIPIAKFLKLLPIIVGPATAIYLVWRYHVATQLSITEFSVRPMADWYIGLIPQILAKMLLVLSKKGYYLILITILIGFGLRGFFRSKTPLDRFAAIGAMVVLGYNAFLLFAYIASFGKFDALRVASFWRYNMHLGAIVIAFGAFGSAVVWRERLSHRWQIKRLAWVPIALVIAAPFVFAPKLRFDRAPLTVHYRVVGADVATLVQPEDYVFTADPTGSGESSAALSYELGERAHLGGKISAFDANQLKHFLKVLAEPKVTVMLIYSTIDGYEAALGHSLPKNQSHLLRRTEFGSWKLLRSWDQPTRK